MESEISDRPLSTTASIIFPFIIKSHGLAFKYDISFYKSSMTRGRLSEGEITQFFRKIEEITDNFEAIRTLEGSVEKLAFRYVVGVYIILGSVFTKNGADFLDTLFMWLCCFIGVAILLQSLFFLLISSRGKFLAEKKTLAKLKNLVDEKNSELMFLDLFWCLPENHFRWIELKLKTQRTQNNFFSEKSVLVFNFSKPECQYVLTNLNNKITEPEMTDNRLSQVDLASFLNQFKQIVLKNRYNTVDRCIFIVGLCLTLEFIIFGLFYSTAFGRVLFIFLLISFFISRIVVKKTLSKEKVLSQNISDHMQQLILEQKAFFSSLGLRWHLSAGSFLTLELWLDYKYSRDSLPTTNFLSEKLQTILEEDPSEVFIDIGTKQRLLE